MREHVQAAVEKQRCDSDCGCQPIYDACFLSCGGKKIPEFFRGVGRGVGELQKGIAESKSALNKSLEDDEKDEKVKPV